MKLTSDEARTILENFRETTQSDKWIDHCICVAFALEIQQEE